MSQANRPYRYTKEATPPSQEVLLLYVENELPREEKEEVAAFLRDYPLYAEAVEGLTGSKGPYGKSTDQEERGEQDVFFSDKSVHDMPSHLSHESKKLSIDHDSTAGDNADYNRPKNVRSDVDQINNKIDIIASQDQKVQQKTAAIPIWRYAAAAILVLLMGFAGYFLTVHLNQQPPGVLSEKQSEEETPEGPIASDDQDQDSNGDDQQAQFEPLTDNADTEEKQADQQQQETTSEQPATQPEGNDQTAATSNGSQEAQNDDFVDETEETKKKEAPSTGPGKALKDQEAGQKETSSQRTQQEAAQAYQAEPEARKESALLPKAMDQFQQDNYSAALKALTKVIDNQPENLKARYYAGLSAFELERYETALDHFNYLVGPEPRHTYFENALWQLGQTHLRNGDTTKAKNVYKRIVANQYKHAKKAGKKLKNLGD